MTAQFKTSKTNASGLRQLGVVAAVLLFLLVTLFRTGLLPGRTVFSNDGPLGVISAQNADIWAAWTGNWVDLNWIGLPGLSALPSVSNMLGLAVGKLIFSKVFAPFALFFAGLCAWFCFRQFKLSPLACFLGAIAVALNTDFVSTACWGVASQVIGFGFFYLALAALADVASPKRWIRVALGGLAVGMGVMEAFDIGALFSLFVGAFVVYQSVAESGPVFQPVGPRQVPGLPKRLVIGLVRLGIVAVFAGFIAWAALSTLIGTQIKGVAGMAQDVETRAQRWDEATTWSLPKREALGIIVPGLFGLRFIPPPTDGGNYWGAIGRHPSWDRWFASGQQGEPPQGPIRYGGGGGYLGITVALVAVWGVLQSFRRRDSVFTPGEQRLIWFWAGVVLVSLLMSFGRFAPFYQLFYALPYASTIRNPTKFIHVLEWAMLILFAYGVHGLSRRYLDLAVSAVRDLPSQWKVWWAKAAGFDRKWVAGSAMAVVASVFGWIIYSSSRGRLVAYLQEVQFDASMANAIASFSIRQVGWFVLYLTVGVGLLAVTLSGYFTGRRAKIGGVLLGLLVVVDLGRVAMPWVVTYNYKERYFEAADNAVIEFLRQKPFEHRVAVWPFGLPNRLGIVQQVYTQEWLHHLFQYYNIQSLDVIMMPRPPVERLAFEAALSQPPKPGAPHPMVRRWELTNTRHLIGAVVLRDVLNTQLDPHQKRFRLLMPFELYQTEADGPILTRTNANGPFALFEFTGALPRAKLYSHWRICTNESEQVQAWVGNLQTNLPTELSSVISQLSTTDQATLQQLTDPAFDPSQTVLLAEAIPASPVATNQSAGTVEFVSYAPKEIVLRAKAETPCVLLLNDKYDPNWEVAVDGKPARLLRCNYLMRGVQLPPGEHQVEFQFRPPFHALYITLAAMGLGLLLLGYLAFSTKREVEKSDQPAAAPRGSAKP